MMGMCVTFCLINRIVIPDDKQHVSSGMTKETKTCLHEPDTVYLNQMSVARLRVTLVVTKTPAQFLVQGFLLFQNSWWNPGP